MTPPKRRRRAKPSEDDNLKHVPDAPIGLTETGRLRWEQFCGMLIDRGQLSSACFASLEQLCKLYDHLAEMDAVLEDEGIHFINTKKIGPEEFVDVPQPHPLLRERCTHLQLLRQYLNDFGFIPKGSVVPTEPSGKKQTTGVVNRTALSDSPFDTQE